MSQKPEDRLNVDPISWEAGQVQPSPIPLPLPPTPPTPSGPDGVDDVGPTRPIDIPPFFPPVDGPPPVDGDNPPIIQDPSGRIPGEPGSSSTSTSKPGHPQNPVPLGQELFGKDAPAQGAGDNPNSMNQ